MTIIAGCLGLVACGSLESNALRSHPNRQQVIDPLSGAGNLAMTTFRATAVATVRQPLTTTKTGISLAWLRSRELFAGNVPTSIEPKTPLSESPGSDGFERFLDSQGLPHARLGKVRCLIDGPAFFCELDDLIISAERSIDVQMYIFDNDDIARRYADRLRQASSRVNVRTMFDDLGSNLAALAAPESLSAGKFIPVNDIGKYLKKDSKIQVRRTLNPWLVSDHTKLVVVDDKVALLGGMNIGREYFSEWHDMMVRIDGPVVQDLVWEFNRTWRKSGPWGDLILLLPNPHPPVPPQPTGTGGIRVLRTDAGNGKHEVFQACIAAIRSSRERVWIETPYFGSDEIIRAVAAAARRGVDVRVVLPLHNDSKLMAINHLQAAQELIEAGATVFSYPEMTHIKVMLCDNWVTLGSANLDTLSMRINRELNIAFRDPVAVRQVEREVFLRDFRKSRRIRLEETHSAIAPLVESIADQL